jgi:hypothetical protein
VEGRRTGVKRFLATLGLLLCLLLLAPQTDYASHIANLIDRAKLKTLGPRGANEHVQKAVYWLAATQQAGQKPTNVVDRGR